MTVTVVPGPFLLYLFNLKILKIFPSGAGGKDLSNTQSTRWKARVDLWTLYGINQALTVLEMFLASSVQNSIVT